jgi:hypothetical protein
MDFKGKNKINNLFLLRDELGEGIGVCIPIAE